MRADGGEKLESNVGSLGADSRMQKPEQALSLAEGYKTRHSTTASQPRPGPKLEHLHS